MIIQIKQIFRFKQFNVYKNNTYYIVVVGIFDDEAITEADADAFFNIFFVLEASGPWTRGHFSKILRIVDNH